MEHHRIANNKLKIKKQIGKGGFGVLYNANTKIKKNLFAVKVEKIEPSRKQLFNEYEVYRYLHTSPQILYQAIPQVYYYGIEGENNVLVTDLLGPSLKDLLELCGTKFSLKTTLMIAIELLGTIEFLHSMRVLHRDIKPANMTIGFQNKQNRIFLIDFGLARKYVTSSGSHIKYRSGKSMVGTAKYSSLGTSEGIEQSRRDDLESFFYVLIYLLKGKLPWGEGSYKNKQEFYKEALIYKRSLRGPDICSGLPDEFELFFNNVRALDFQQKPDYVYLQSLIKDLFIRQGFIKDYDYDWVGHPGLTKIKKI